MAAASHPHTPRPDAHPLVRQQDTKLAANAEEERAWVEKQQAASSSGGGGGNADGSAAAAPVEYHFVCEAFFMALKSLHFGLVKLIDRRDNLGRDMQHRMRDVQAMEGAMAR